MAKIIDPRNLRHATPQQVAAAQRGELVGMPLNADAAVANALNMAAKLLTGAINRGRIPAVGLVIEVQRLTAQAMANIIATQLTLQEQAAPKVVDPRAVQPDTVAKGETNTKN